MRMEMVLAIWYICEVIYRAISRFIIPKTKENLVYLALTGVGHSLVNSYLNSEHPPSEDEY